MSDVLQILSTTRLARHTGRVLSAFGTTVRATGLDAHIGQICRIVDPSGSVVRAEVVGIQDGVAILTPLTALMGISQDASVHVEPNATKIGIGHALLGRVMTASGLPLDDLGPFDNIFDYADIHASPPNPMQRKIIQDVLPTGIRAIDGLLSVGIGQRVGIFAAAGGGKSTLLGMLARYAEADIIVIALIGERGREVREFIEDSLGAEGLSRAILVVATSDQPAMERVRAAHVATAIAEGFRKEGKRVLLLMDSVTRFARALREIGLSIGEPPVRRGFPPSVFAEMPKLFERSGNDDRGSITAFYTVLMEDEDSNDPIAEEVRSILDGHIYLSRKLAAANHYPAIDILASLSRVFGRIASDEQKKMASQMRACMVKYAEIEFLLQVGEYKPGGDPLADAAVDTMPSIRDFLRQDAHRPSAIEDTLQQMHEITA